MANRKNKKRKSRLDMSLFERISKYKKAGLDPGEVLQPGNRDFSLLPIDERIEKIMEIMDNISAKKPSEIAFLLMYDISDNKIRNMISKYLIKKGCQRIQKSVFVALLDYKVYHEIYRTIQEIQEFYEVEDSVLFVPLSISDLEKVKMIGRQIEMEVLLGRKRTLFF